VTTVFGAWPCFPLTSPSLHPIEKNKMKKIVVLMVSAGLCASAASAPFVPMTPGQYMKGQLAQGIGQMALAIGALAGANRELEIEVVNARREFFANARTAAGPVAAKRFEEALHKRDLHYVVYDIMRNPANGHLMKFALDSANSRGVDGGISPYCYASFRKWSVDLTSNVSALGALDKALDASMPTFEKYVAERNLTEALFFNPGSVLRSQNPNAEEYLAAWLIGTKAEPTVAAANASATRIAGQVGATRLAQIVAVLRDWTAVTNQLEGPFMGNPQFVIGPLVSGKPNPPTEADWTGNGRVFSEIRGRLLSPKVNLAGSVDDVQRLWESGRKSRDLATLYQAAARRDALVNEIERKSEENLEFRYDGKDLVKSMSELNFMFIDRGISAIELDMMIRGEKNLRGERAAGETKNYLVWNAKLVPRFTTPPPERPRYDVPGIAAASATSASAASPAPASMPAAGERRTRRGAPDSAGTAAPPAANVSAPAPTAAAGSGPVLPDPNEEGVGPFDRAIILTQNLVELKMNPGLLSTRLHIHAKQWETQYKFSSNTREHYLGKVIEDTQLVVRDVRNQAADQLNTVKNNSGVRANPEMRKGYEDRAAALNGIADELDARIPDMRRKMKDPAPFRGD
jgi:hypothetical protein